MPPEGSDTIEYEWTLFDMPPSTGISWDVARAIELQAAQHQAPCVIQHMPDNSGPTHHDRSPQMI